MAEQQDITIFVSKFKKNETCDEETDDSINGGGRTCYILGL
jgi:hypothetical protein